jgi:virginiamycin B lyase
MKRKIFFALALATAALFALLRIPTPVRSADSTSTALTGAVSSQEEGVMEGVLVSAKKAGSTMTVTVVSDAQGRYSFPRARLEPGRYALRMRAVGYEMDDIGPVEITGEKSAQLDLKLHKTHDLSAQLSNGEWIASMSGSHEQKNMFMSCVSCHSLERVVKSRYSANEWPLILKRMAGYAPGSTPLRPQRRVALGEAEANPDRLKTQAEYLSTINLSSVTKWQYPLKTLPRPKGKATRVIITEYDLPRFDAEPHDVIVDSDGKVWYSDFGQQYLGKLDPKTAKVVEYSYPELKPGFPTGALDLEFDHQGNLWLGMMLQGGIAKFDKKTEKFQIFTLPKEINNDAAQIAMVMPRYYQMDGKVWTNNVGRRSLQRLDVQSGQIELINPFQNIPKDLPDGTLPHSVYGIAADSQNNNYFMDFSNRNIGRIDAKTGEITFYSTPTPRSAPRRGHMDSQDRLWFAEYLGNNIAMFDTRTRKIQEWTMPTPWTGPYDVTWDKNGDLWTAGMTTDRVIRLNTQTAESIEYLLPRTTNVRRVDVDNSTNPPTFWIGNNHGASIIKLEPME